MKDLNNADQQIKIMRDVFLSELYLEMAKNPKIFFLTDDFGSPQLDRIKTDFRTKFINMGIAEQNCVNVATGLALEGFVVYVYAIGSFLTMRAFEQIRNLGLLSQIRPININLVGVGAGLSYDVSGPTHHCLEDLSIIRTISNIDIFSPSDWVLVQEFVNHSIVTKHPKYLRLDGKPTMQIYDSKNFNLEVGFKELVKGNNICLVSTGFMTQTALKIADGKKIGLIDVFCLRPLNERQLFKALDKYKIIITLEEGFINKGGLDSLISSLLAKNRVKKVLKKIGFEDRYSFEVGGRDYLHKLNGLDVAGIQKIVKE